jgi:hypothetical protein
MIKRLAVASLVAVLLPLHAAALENEDLLALVAMPLAVAAVSEMTDVPVSQLVDVITLLNGAAVPPAQFIEVVRYAPVALVVENDEPDFVEFIRVREQEGLRGTQLVTVIEEHIRTFGVPEAELDVTAPRLVVFENEVEFVPQIVRTRVAEVKAHPHGGPPGQLKKQRGLQTGAEIVHGTAPARARVRSANVDDDNRGSNRVAKPRVVKVKSNDGNDGVRDVKKAKQENRGRGNVAKERHDDHGGGNGKSKGQGGGNDGGGQGKGKGKGKG